jgi:hypothetical protein
VDNVQQCSIRLHKLAYHPDLLASQAGIQGQTSTASAGHANTASSAAAAVALTTARATSLLTPLQLVLLFSIGPNQIATEGATTRNSDIVGHK